MNSNVNRRDLLKFGATAVASVGLSSRWLFERTTFKDVPRSHTHHASIEYAVDRGYMQGRDGGEFSPDRHVTRAQLTSVLSDMERRWVEPVRNAPWTHPEG